MTIPKPSEIPAIEKFAKQHAAALQERVEELCAEINGSLMDEKLRIIEGSVYITISDRLHFDYKIRSTVMELYASAGWKLEFSEANSIVILTPIL